MKLSPKLSLVLLAATESATKSAVSGWADHPRQLSYANVAGYQPDSQVTDQCAIDLDQAAIEDQLALQTLESFQNARRIYNQGGNSKSYALINLANGLASSISKGEIITGMNAEGNEISGEAYEAYEAGSVAVKVQYPTSDIQESYVECRVGALAETRLEGCFMAVGELSIYGRQYPYTYDPAMDNRNGRTIAGFSTGARAKMLECASCPYQDFKFFYDYYGRDDYAHQFVEAAFDGATTSFANGNADFSQYGFEGRRQAIELGTVYLSIFMYVIRQFEDAVDGCNEGRYDTHAWDEGVCFYTGSLEGRDGTGSGKLLHQLADNRCTNFKTCDVDGSDLDGMAKLNYDVFDLFAVGNFQLQRGSCADLRNTVGIITSKMYIPMIQGALRYAFNVDKLSGGEKGKAEGAVYAAAILPRVHAVSPNAAAIIYDNMKVGASSTDVQTVKYAFETVYADIGISCAEVGGLWSYGDNNYYPGMEPCIEMDQSASSPPTGNPTPSQSVLTTTGRPSNSAITEAPTTSSLSIVDGDMSTMTSIPSTSIDAKNPTASPLIITVEGAVYYPNFSNEVCLDDGEFPPNLPEEHLFQNVTQCCDTLFPTNMEACLQARVPTASATPPGAKDWYPDYDNDTCKNKNDEQQVALEINFFDTHEECCKFGPINTEKCLQALNVNADDGIGSDDDFEVLDSDASKHAISMANALTLSLLMILIYHF